MIAQHVVKSHQAQNVEAERKAIEIRIRAERRAGQLLAEINPGQGGDRKSKRHTAALIPYREAKETAKISDTQAKRWQVVFYFFSEEKRQAAALRPTKVTDRRLGTVAQPLAESLELPRLLLLPAPIFQQITWPAEPSPAVIGS